jgi:hypothetical protein
LTLRSLGRKLCALRMTSGLGFLSARKITDLKGRQLANGEAS